MNTVTIRHHNTVDPLQAPEGVSVEVISYPLGHSWWEVIRTDPETGERLTLGQLWYTLDGGAATRQWRVRQVEGRPTFSRSTPQEALDALLSL